MTCGNFSDVPPLEASEFELIRAWLTRPVWARDGTRAVRAPARDLIQPHLSLSGVRQTDDNHAVVQKDWQRRKNGRLLPPVLRGCRRKNGRNFADQLSSKP